MKRVHVAVGVIRNPQNEVLISLRANNAHMGGLWEFPGGKLEADESPILALQRELHEELGIVAKVAQPLIRIHHDYVDKNVLLDVWEVIEWSGQPDGREGQPIEWVAAEALSFRQFPVANQPIIEAVKLPTTYPIINANLSRPELAIEQLQLCLASGHRMLQLRAKSRLDDPFEELAKEALKLTNTAGATLLLNADIATAKRLGSGGVHLNSQTMMALNSLGGHADLLVGASCHNVDELMKAQQLGVNFAVLSSVSKTPSHPAAVPLGWEVFKSLVERINVPIYALGGMRLGDVKHARSCGGQGIAGIRMFLPETQ